jgi:hypothetical protein
VIFFIFPDFTIFYALLDVPPPQPVLWFHKGLTYHDSYDEDLDKWIVSDLNKNNVEIVIVEEKSFIDTSERLNDFPGELSEGETLVPIPNTAVKPFSADGTALATTWESRTLPGYK